MTSFKKSKCYGTIIKCSTTGKYLLVKGFTGKWSFPKGHREKGESAIECAKRELYEETGIKINDFENKKAIFISLYYYYTHELSEELDVIPIDTTEILDVKWLSLDEIKLIEKNRDVNAYFYKLEQKTLKNIIDNNSKVKTEPSI